jgi:hypothetical protein
MIKDWLTMLGLLLLVVHGAHSQTGLRAGPAAAAAKVRIPLQSSWRFREVGKEAWHPATIPGCVHTDLLNNKLIEDPFYRNNEQKVQ